MKRLNKKRIILTLTLVVGVALIPFVITNHEDMPINPDATLPTGQTTHNAPSPKDVNYKNFAPFLETTQFVKDIPNDGKILLSFYNFNSGERQIEKSFIIKKNKVEEGAISNPDLNIYIHSKYLKILNSQNFCSTVSSANRNKDLGYEYSMSTGKLVWKFKGLHKYKSCFGF